MSSAEGHDQHASAPTTKENVAKLFERDDGELIEADNTVAADIGAPLQTQINAQDVVQDRVCATIGKHVKDSRLPAKMPAREQAVAAVKKPGTVFDFIRGKGFQALMSKTINIERLTRIITTEFRKTPALLN